MNVLIIADMRCGGRYLCESLSKKYSLKYIHEPSSDRLKLLNLDNSCVKLIIYQYTIDELVSISKEFDNIYLLSRKNRKEHIESCIALQEVTKNMYTNWIWKDEYYEIGRGFEHYSKFLDRNKILFDELSSRLNKEILYYEDLFSETKEVKLGNLSFIADVSKKLRISKPTKLI